MKKILISAIAMSLMAVSAFGTDGTVDSLKVENDGTVMLRLTKDTGGLTNIFPIVAASPDALKALIAVALTAKTTGAAISANYGTVDGVSGWVDFTMK